MEQVNNQQVQLEFIDNMDLAVRSMLRALSVLEADGNCVDEACKLWKIVQAAVSLSSKYAFLYRLGLWSCLKTTSV